MPWFLRLGAFKGSRPCATSALFQEMVRVDQRIRVIEIPSQDVISRDNVSMKVDAVLYFNVVDPERAIIHVQNYLPATNMFAQTTLRAVLGQHELDEMLSERKKLSADVQSILDADGNLGHQGQQCRDQNGRTDRQHDASRRAQIRLPEFLLCRP